ncbi:TrmB family transcriptional regulator [Desulfurobacterium indicum]|uniref:Transcriptional regulator TrmB n=1 Tax=Desulfurobacterium indicum TaxID=1914305 RepID=A0A1R1MLI8_9BACT|nr:helix-turn-helix domain-containing protein [Desulfurobacterium indicum]OMH40657.1 transcriptional regulator TrmB [Desulfurobacterium indicum]
MPKISIDETFVKLLNQYGLTSYEAKAYYALLILGEATATNVAKWAGIPQQRVYDALSALERKGFIHIKHTNPKKFLPFSPRKALENRITQLKLEFELKEQELKKLIPVIEGKVPEVRDKSYTGSQVMILEGNEAIVSKVIEMLSSAEKIVKISGIKPLYVLGCKGSLEKYVRQGVKLFAMGRFDKECVDEIKKLKGEFKEADVSFRYQLIVDDKKLLMVYVDNDNMPYGFYTENSLLIEPYIFYFDKAWESNGENC